MSFSKARPPRLIIEIPLEETPSVRIHCANSSEEERLREYLASRSELRRLVEDACKLEHERAA